MVGLWTPGCLNSGCLDTWTLDTWTLGLKMPGRLDSGRLDSRLSALGLWMSGCLDSGHLDSGRLDNRLTFNNYALTTKEILELATLISSYWNQFEIIYICNCSFIIEKWPFKGWITATVVAKLTQNLWKKGWLQLWIFGWLPKKRLFSKKQLSLKRASENAPYHGGKKKSLYHTSMTLLIR